MREPATPLKPGQIWRDCDPRTQEVGGRFIKLKEIGTEHVKGVICTAQGDETNRQTRIKKSRLHKSSNGYELFKDVP